MTDVPIMFYGTAEAPQLQPGALPELTRVALVRPVTTDDGVTVPAGAEGTIVGLWAGGEAYEVEFAEPVSGLATVDAADVRALEPAKR